MTKRKTRHPKKLEQPREVRVKPHSYQPTKAEMDELIDIRNPEGTRPTPDELARAVLAPVKVIQDKDA